MLLDQPVLKKYKGHKDQLALLEMLALLELMELMELMVQLDLLAPLEPMVLLDHKDLLARWPSRTCWTRWS